MFLISKGEGLMSGSPLAADGVRCGTCMYQETQLFSPVASVKGPYPAKWMHSNIRMGKQRCS